MLVAMVKTVMNLMTVMLRLMLGVPLVFELLLGYLLEAVQSRSSSSCEHTWDPSSDR